MSGTVKKYAEVIAQVLVGNILYAFGVVAFVLPCGLITGGTTGLALFFNQQMGIPVSGFVSISNTVMFLLGALVLGRRFAASTLVGTVTYPVILSILENLPVNWRLTDDPMLAVICAGILIGVGMGIILRTGTSGGGLDVPPLILYKKKGIPVSVTMYAMDFVILLLQMARAEMEGILYGILLVLIYTFVIDKAMVIGKAQMRVEVISPRAQEIAAAIQTRMDRGCTYYKGRTGHMREECLVVMTIVSSRELPRLKRITEEIDPHAFFIAGRVTEVLGRGFSDQKEPRIIPEGEETEKTAE